MNALKIYLKPIQRKNFNLIVCKGVRELKSKEMNKAYSLPSKTMLGIFLS